MNRFMAAIQGRSGAAICRLALLLLVLLAGAGARAQTGADDQTALGSAYRIANGEMLYTELHRWDDIRHSVEYRLPDGELFATNDLDFSRALPSPAYTQHYLRDNSTVGARWAGDRLVLFNAGRERTVGFKQPLVISSGFFHFIQAHWDELGAGAVLPFEFALPERLTMVALRMRQVTAAQSGIDGGEPDWRYFRVEVASKLIGWLVEPLNVAFDAQRRLVVYRGASNVKDDRGDTPQVVIRYSYGGAAERLDRMLSQH